MNYIETLIMIEKNTFLSETTMLKSLIKELLELDQYDLPFIQVHPHLLKYKVDNQYPRAAAVKLISRLLTAHFSQFNPAIAKRYLVDAGVKSVITVGDFALLTLDNKWKTLNMWVPLREGDEFRDVKALTDFAKSDHDITNQTIVGRIDISYYSKTELTELLTSYPGIVFGNKDNDGLYQLSVDSYNKLMDTGRLPRLTNTSDDDGWFIIKGDEKVPSVPRSV